MVKNQNSIFLKKITTNLIFKDENDKKTKLNFFKK
jgi:hypothetical protein